MIFLTQQLLTLNLSMKEGIYFNMPDSEYHSIPYFSRSMVQYVNMGAEEAWHQAPINPNKALNESSYAMDLGTAMHSMILEPEIFNQLYIRRPKKEDYTNKIILDKVSELQDFLESVGEKKTGRKDDLIGRAIPYLNPNTHIVWEGEMHKFDTELQLRGCKELNDNEIEILNAVQDNINNTSQIKQVFQNGYPEVTIIWKDEESGVMCKCRLDYVRPEAIGELKTFSLKYKKNLTKLLCDIINFERYNMQFAIYHQALSNIIKKINAKKAEVFGDVDAEWLDKFLQKPNKQFLMVFVRTQAPYQVRCIELEQSSTVGATDNEYFTQGYTAFRNAINLYAEYLKKPTPWKEEKEIITLSDEDVPNIIFQN